MDINIVAGKFSEANNKYIFETLKNRDRSKKHIIIAPDRSLFSLEQRLFEETQESCFFDVSVTSISKLAKTLLQSQTHKNILTKQSGVALVKKLLNDNKDKLSTFRKSISYMGFASTLFETICLFKSCNIPCTDVYVDDSDNHFNLKQKDIKLIYSEYENYLQKDFTDSFNQLNLFATLIDREFCQNTVFYFMEFDDFTSIMYSIIEKLSRFSDKIYLCATYGKTNNNSNIYTNKVYYDLISLFKSNGLQYSVQKLDNYLALDKILANNLLSYNSVEKIEVENNKIKINSFDNIRDEIKYTIAKIYSEVKGNKNLTFSDFAIVVPSILEYESIIKRELAKYKINYFIDCNQIMMSHILIRNLYDVCKIIAGDFVLSDFTNLIKSDLLNFNIEAVNNLDNTLKRLGSKGWACLNPHLIDDADLNEFIQMILSYRSQLNELTTSKDFVDTIIQNIYNYIILRSESYLQKIEPLDLRVWNQVIGKIESINKDFLSVFADLQIDFADFVETYFSYYETTNISMPPITSNTLFIADFNGSYISTYAHMYILGCNEGILPKFKLDNGLISDEEIARLPNASKINPTISMLNARKNFKLFELIFKAKDSLTLSYMTANLKGKLFPNNLIISLQKILNIKAENKSIELDLINSSYFALNADNIAFNNLNESVTISNILDLLKNWETYRTNTNYRAMLSTLINVNKSEELDKLIENMSLTGNYENLSNANMFKNNTTSVSQIESYYNCPYMHFARYGLKLNKREEYKLQANDIGSIIHAVLKSLMPFLLDNIQDIEAIKVKAKILLDALLQSDDYIDISRNTINSYVIKSLYKELQRVCVAVVNEINNSSYKPSLKHLEYNFNSDKLSSHGIKIKGSIDRVDMCGDDFIVIDYKTGNNSFENYNDVFTGKKLQLLVYANAFEKESHKNLKGVYYFPLSNAFGKADSYPYRFNGITFKSKENILAMDNNLCNSGYKSKILNLSTGKSGDFYKNNYYNNLCLESEDLDYLISFAMKKVDKAIANIMAGDINPNPIRHGNNIVCDYCDYKGLCNYLGNNDKADIKIATIEDLKAKEDDNGTRTE